jgi:Domain of unknown function (DUF6946)
MNRIFIPATKAEDWKSLLAEPEKQWRTGYSAKSIAHCWQEANGFPECVKNVFTKSGIRLFRNIELLLAFPEYKVPLPGGRRASQNDLFVLARGDNQLISITVEGKVSEPFGETIGEWKEHESKGKAKRLEFLLNELQLANRQIDTIRYQLLHRTASAVIEARKFNAENALMLVHSFSKSYEGFDDFCQFLALFGLRETTPDSLVFAKRVAAANLYFGWVKGDDKFLRL